MYFMSQLRVMMLLPNILYVTVEGHDADSNNVLQYYLPVHSPVLMIDEESGVLSGDQMVRERTLIRLVFE